MNLPDNPSPIQNELFSNLFSKSWLLFSFLALARSRLQSQALWRLIWTRVNNPESFQSWLSWRNPGSKLWKSLFIILSSDIKFPGAGRILVKLCLCKCSKLLLIIFATSDTVMLKASVMMDSTWLLANKNSSAEIQG